MLSIRQKSDATSGKSINTITRDGLAETSDVKTEKPSSKRIDSDEDVSTLPIRAAAEYFLIELDATIRVERSFEEHNSKVNVNTILRK